MVEKETIAECPHCGNVGRQVKAGLHGGRQRYKCGVCQRRYTPEAVPGRAYAEETRRKAIVLHEQGMTNRQIARQLGVSHQSVSNWLRAQENAGETADALLPSLPTLTTAKRRPTIEDVARQAGVSTTSVSNYLNGKGRMAEQTRRRIQAAMEALYFTPNALVRAIRSRHTNILGVVLYGLGHLDEREGPALTAPLLRGIHDAADAADNDLLLYTGWPKRDRGDLGERFLGGHIDGLIWVNPGMAGPDPTAQHPVLERVTAAGLPVLALLTRHVPAGVGYVNADNLGAMQTLVAHLAARGHRRIAFVGPGRLSNALDRHEGYRHGLEAQGLAWDPALQVMVERRVPGAQDCARVLESWLVLPSPPSAVMCASDLLAAAFAASIQERGRIPDDIALSGFDDMPIAEHIAGGLTVRQPFRQMGMLAAEGLLALVEGEEEDAWRLSVPAELIVRASTGGDPYKPEGRAPEET